MHCYTGVVRHPWVLHCQHLCLHSNNGVTSCCTSVTICLSTHSLGQWPRFSILTTSLQQLITDTSLSGRLEAEAGHSARRRAGQRAEEQRLQAGQVDCPEYPRWGGQPQVRLRDQIQREGQLQARHSRHSAVQTGGVRSADQPQHGQRLGSGQVHPGSHHGTEG